MIYIAILALPLIGFIVAGGLRRQIGAQAAMAVTTGGVSIAAVLSVIVFFQVAIGGATVETVQVLRWIDVGGFQADWALRIDTLTAVMLVVVTGVSALVHIYSIGYMDHDPDKARFFSYLSLFTFAMLMLVTADNFLQLFFGWEGVGLASYLLIGFWYRKDTANAAAIKAFVVNRIGDFGFALGIMAVFVTFGTLKFDPIFAAIAANSFDVPGVAPLISFADGAGPLNAVMPFVGSDFAVLEIIAFLLFIGAMGKSAQFFLHVWLPDAMEGPTPVSALIHAATMVTAGVFLVCRCYPIYDHAPMAAGFVTVIGAVTALYAATVGLAQNDIKRVVAYSTCSQLGYMFFAAGVGSYGAAMFHLFTHAFFKALLFLGAGAVIHGLHDEQDMRKMGGLASKMRWTWVMMLLGTLALTGVGIPGTPFGFAGFFSKDRVIEDAFLMGEAGGQAAMFAFWMGIIAAFLTSFYSWRLMFMTFHGAPQGPQSVHDHAHDPPWVMRGPLLVLAAGAVFTGVVFYPAFVGDRAKDFWAGSIPPAAYKLDTSESAAPTPEALTDASLTEEVALDQPATAIPSEAAIPAEAVPTEQDASAIEPLETALGGTDTTTHANDDHADEGHGEAHGESHDAHDSYHVPGWVLWLPVQVTAAGFVLALFFYGLNQGLGARIAARGGPMHNFLSNKWYFDEIYNATIVRLVRGLGDLFWKGGDKNVIDRLGPDGAAAATMRLGRWQARLQTGYLYHYAFVMLVGVAVLATVLLWRMNS